MTLAAHQALREADVVVGYKGYIDALGDLLAPHQTIIASGMQTELDRARHALDHAVAGKRVALVSSGDIGIYAMAGPVFELLAERGWNGSEPEVVVLAGVSAFQAAAAHLGAAISHDFCVISLSDLLTPWPLIEQRLAAAATGDFVVALYNPRSRERHWQLEAAFDLLRQQRPANTPVAFATNVSRPNEQFTLTTLGAADPSLANMFTVVLIGNSRSYRMGDRFVTPRGYAEAKLRGDNPPSPATQVHEQTENVFVAAKEHKGTQQDDAAFAPLPQRGRGAGGEGQLGHAHHTYPIVLTNLSASRAVVVGGGPVGERKVRGLLAVGCAVTLISPDATAALQVWAAAGQLTWAQRCYQPSDLTDAGLVFATTNQREVNAAIAHAAAERGMLCNVADAPNEGSFHLPALHRSPECLIAVSTDGNAPGRAAAIRDALARFIAEEEGTRV
ncbi:precorrin-3B C(17)-methyltransferase [Candidatus Viridilinea mediisalina]|uniref:precorrin-2 dehydrogenase n=2 Tax=Candidatus Viridilinea mediisalina TaxID=2024553 RepID=A0A2A6REJ2_9CHLR|nr:precorrin-3B C(17)-methyltransferase [Candidatus Viridilinea mediisalina]